MKKQYVNGYGKSTTPGKEKLAMAVLVGICIAAALVTFFTVTLVKKIGSAGGSDKLTQNVKSEIYEVEEEIAVVEDETENIGISDSKEGAVRETKEEVSEPGADVQEAETVVSNEVLTFSAPCKGKIINDFSPNVPVYSKTLEDWRVHNGIDIHAPLGAEVCAIAKGTVVDTIDDLRYGYTIVIDHGIGLRSIYSNLASVDGVSVGTEVKKGNVIATVGDTALFETVADTHIHFEMTKDGVYVNPLNYFE